MQTILRSATLGVLLCLAACGGGGGGDKGDGAVALATKDDALRELALVFGEVAGFMDEATDIGSPGGVPPGDDVDTYFTNQVQPRLDFCRTCHVPGGTADVPAGDGFMLIPQREQDRLLFRQSWEQLGRGVETSPLLRYPSGAETHTGGAPWPTGSDAYESVRRLLACWESPASCDLETARAASAKAAENCGTGTSVEQDDLTPYRYAFFNRAENTSLSRRTDKRCIVTGNTSRETFHGVTEFGSTGAAADGARFAYLKDGAGNAAYEQVHEELAGGYKQTWRRSGSVEARDTDEALDLRAVYALEYRDSQGFFAEVSIGRSGSPFRLTRDGDGLRLDGDYDYASSDCRGGSVTVATLESLSGDADAGFDAGRLKLSSGKRSITVRFNGNGDATLDLNGSPVMVPAAEVRQAMAGAPCG